MPIRTCVGCRATEEPTAMVRVVAHAGRVVVGRALPGRGAWLHPGCLEAALRRRALPRALRAPGVSTEGLAEALASAAASGQGPSR